MWVGGLCRRWIAAMGVLLVASFYVVYADCVLTED